MAAFISLTFFVSKLLLPLKANACAEILTLSEVPAVAVLTGAVRVAPLPELVAAVLGVDGALTLGVFLKESSIFTIFPGGGGAHRS